jgi:hypothetical protein
MLTFLYVRLGRADWSVAMLMSDQDYMPHCHPMQVLHHDPVPEDVHQ